MELSYEAIDSKGTFMASVAEGSAFTYFSWPPETSPSQCLYALYAEHSDRVLDGSGREGHLDFTRGGCTEKLFRKLLFPVDSR